MINLTLGNISITSIGHSSGFFIGEKNTHKKFRSNKIVNDVVGVVSGDENLVIDNVWLNNKKKGRSE
ncbi:hypothetical protein [Bacillus sp. AFS037270]|uniref:hypothetical protein n=1 Tax=Bacillus sp. AFS037270 TaxID=2033499 RepID=UPI000BFE3D0A|nr:hypothetical protein [Bacillus sp. AFS037270]PGV48711.1 hypothetical protein COD92_25150 [Bacillus sp. AFS037270]